MRLLVKRIIVVSLLLLLVLPLMPTTLPVKASETNVKKFKVSPELKVHPLLLKDEYYKMSNSPYPRNVNIDSAVLLSAGLGRVIVIAKGLNADLSKYFLRVINIFGVGGLTYVYGLTTKENVLAMANDDRVMFILPDIRLVDIFKHEKRLVEVSLNKSESFPVNGGGQALPESPEFEYPSWLEIIKAMDVWEEFGIAGQGVTIGFIDTGVDFATPNLGLDAIARDENDTPLIFDADELGLVLTVVEAVPNATGYINIDPNDVLVFDSSYGAIYNLSYGYVYSHTTDEMVTFNISTWYVGDISLLPVKFGLLLQFVYVPYYGWYEYTVPIILASSNGEYYDTVYADLSTLWQYIAYMLGYIDTPTPDFNFTDEKPMMYGDEISYYDWDVDGMPDFTAGTLAGYVYDVYGVVSLLERGIIPVPPPDGTVYLYTNNTWHVGDAIAAIYPGLDPDGLYAVIAYDFYGHGTACANVAAGRGYSFITYYGWRYMYGVAPAAKVASAGALWYGNTIAALLFLSGFDPVPPKYTWGNWTWVYRGSPRVDITSSSYGFVAAPLFGYATGYDPWSLFYDYVILKTGVINVVAAGNNGPGFNTVTPPTTSSYSISVAASTSYGYRVDFGYLHGSWDDVVIWSSRGPSNLGSLKPDVTAIGAFGWTAGFLWAGVGNGWFASEIFGGTSMAAPMTAGTVALMVSAFKSLSKSYTPELVKLIIKSTTDSLTYDPLSQGTGRINAYKAVSFIINNDGFLVYSSSQSEKFAPEILDTLNAYTDEDFKLTDLIRNDVGIYLGDVRRGGIAWARITIEGAGTYKIKPVTLKVVSEEVYEIPINLSEIPSGSTLILGVFDESYFTDVDMVELALTFNYSYLDPYGRSGYYQNWLELMTVLRYWIDLNNDSTITLNETAWLHNDYRIANTITLTIANASTKFEGVLQKVSEQLGIPYEDLLQMSRAVVLTLHVFYNAWYNQTSDIAVFKLIVRKYKFEDWPIIFAPKKIKVSTKRVFTAFLRVPWDYPSGYYVGYLIVTREDDGRKILVPISFTVATTISYVTTWVTLPERSPPSDLYYNNYALRGAFDWYGWYVTSDWRVFTINIKDPNVKALLVTVMWPYKDSNLDVILAGPRKVVVIDWNTYEIKKDMILNGLVTGGKLTYPLYMWGWLPHFDLPAPGVAMIIMPVWGPGKYRLLIRNAPFAGEVYAEPFIVQVTPIRMFHRKWFRMPSTASTLYRVTVYSATPILNESWAYPFIDGFNSTHYIDDISTVGIYLGEDQILLKRRGIFYVDMLKLNITTDSTPKERYFIGWYVETPIPTLAVGYYYGGYEYMYYDNTLPILFTLVVR